MSTRAAHHQRRTRKDPRPLLEALEALEVPPASLPCIDAEDVDWHSDSAGERRLAAYLCRQGQCPLLEACHALAEANRERHGVWGGVDRESAYRAAHEAAREPRPIAPCGSESGYKRHRRRREPACPRCLEAHAATQAARRQARATA